MKVGDVEFGGLVFRNRRGKEKEGFVEERGTAGGDRMRKAAKESPSGLQVGVTRCWLGGHGRHLVSRKRERGRYDGYSSI